MRHVHGLVFLLFALVTVVTLSGTNAQEPEYEPLGPIRWVPSLNDGFKFEPTKAQEKFSRVKKARETHYGNIRMLFQKAGIDYPAEEVLLRVFKGDDIIELWARPQKQKQFKLLDTYDICARSGELGPKRQEWDMQVPEGFYHVTYFHPESDYHLAMLINYPNESDKIRTTNPKSPGNNILIHGRCCTLGCIPITDEWIEELYLISLDSYSQSKIWPSVHIFPTLLDGKGMAQLRKKFAGKPELLSFWEELQVGYQKLEETHTLPKFTVQKDGSYHFPK